MVYLLLEPLELCIITAAYALTYALTYILTYALTYALTYTNSTTFL